MAWLKMLITHPVNKRQQWHKRWVKIGPHFLEVWPDPLDTEPQLVADEVVRNNSLAPNGERATLWVYKQTSSFAGTRGS